MRILLLSIMCYQSTSGAQWLIRTLAAIAWAHRLPQRTEGEGGLGRRYQVLLRSLGISVPHRLDYVGRQLLVHALGALDVSSVLHPELPPLHQYEPLVLGAHRVDVGVSPQHVGPHLKPAATIACLAIAAPKRLHHVHLLLQPPLMHRASPFPVQLGEVVAGHALSLGQLITRLFEVEHRLERGKQFGYAVSDPSGFKVVVSGDTRPCDGLRQQVEGADLAVIEATFRDQDHAEAVRAGHMTKAEADSVGKRAKRVIYIHQLPRYFPP